MGSPSKVRWIAIWEGVALTAAQVTLFYNALLAANYPESVPPKVFLRVSHDRGGTYSDPIEGQFGDTGDYAGMPYWTNLGIARDFVLELSWSAPINTALNGLFIEATPAGW